MSRGLHSWATHHVQSVSTTRSKLSRALHVRVYQRCTQAFRLHTPSSSFIISKFKPARLKFTVYGHKQPSIHTHIHNTETLVWDSLRLAPITRPDHRLSKASRCSLNPGQAPQRLSKAISRLPPSHSSSTETVKGYYKCGNLLFELHRDCWRLLHVCHPPVQASQRLLKAITHLPPSHSSSTETFKGYYTFGNPRSSSTKTVEG